MYDQKRLLGSTYINSGTNEISRDEKFIVPLSFHDEKKYGRVPLLVSPEVLANLLYRDQEATSIEVSNMLIPDIQPIYFYVTYDLLGESVYSGGISILDSLVKVSGWSLIRQDVLIKIIKKDEEIAVDYVEMTLPEVHISPRDLWFYERSLIGSILYTGVPPLTSQLSPSYYPPLTITRLLRNTDMSLNNSYRVTENMSFSSGLVTEETKFLIRPKSQRIIIIILLSTELWTFSNNGFPSWRSILLFFQEYLSTSKSGGESHFMSIVLTYRKKVDKSDYYEVFWEGLMSHLTKSNNGINDFLNMLRVELNTFEKRIISSLDICSYSESNVLESINLALNQLDNDFVDRSLIWTGKNIKILSVGPPLLIVDVNNYKDILHLANITEKRFLRYSVSTDFISLSQLKWYYSPFLYVVEFSSTQRVKKIVETIPLKLPMLIHYFIYEFGKYEDPNLLNIESTIAVLDQYIMDEDTDIKFNSLNHNLGLKTSRNYNPNFSTGQQIIVSGKELNAIFNLQNSTKTIKSRTKKNESSFEHNDIKNKLNTNTKSDSEIHMPESLNLIPPIQKPKYIQPFLSDPNFNNKTQDHNISLKELRIFNFYQNELSSNLFSKFDTIKSHFDQFLPIISINPLNPIDRRYIKWHNTFISCSMFDIKYGGVFMSSILRPVLLPLITNFNFKITRKMPRISNWTITPRRELFIAYYWSNHLIQKSMNQKSEIQTKNASNDEISSSWKEDEFNKSEHFLYKKEKIYNSRYTQFIDETQKTTFNIPVSTFLLPNTSLLTTEIQNKGINSSNISISSPIYKLSNQDSEILRSIFNDIIAHRLCMAFQLISPKYSTGIKHVINHNTVQMWTCCSSFNSSFVNSDNVHQLLLLDDNNIMVEVMNLTDNILKSLETDLANTDKVEDELNKYNVITNNSDLQIQNYNSNSQLNIIFSLPSIIKYEYNIINKQYNQLELHNTYSYKSLSYFCDPSPVNYNFVDELLVWQRDIPFVTQFTQESFKELSFLQQYSNLSTYSIIQTVDLAINYIHFAVIAHWKSSSINPIIHGTNNVKNMNLNTDISKEGNIHSQNLHKYNSSNSNNSNKNYSHLENQTRSACYSSEFEECCGHHIVSRWLDIISIGKDLNQFYSYFKPSKFNHRESIKSNGEILDNTTSNHLKSSIDLTCNYVISINRRIYPRAVRLKSCLEKLLFVNAPPDHPKILDINIIQDATFKNQQFDEQSDQEIQFKLKSVHKNRSRHKFYRKRQNLDNSFDYNVKYKNLNPNSLESHKKHSDLPSNMKSMRILTSWCDHSLWNNHANITSNSMSNNPLLNLPSVHPVHWFVLYYDSLWYPPLPFKFSIGWVSCPAAAISRIIKKIRSFIIQYRFNLIQIPASQIYCLPELPELNNLLILQSLPFNYPIIFDISEDNQHNLYNKMQNHLKNFILPPLSLQLVHYTINKDQLRIFLIDPHGLYSLEYNNKWVIIRPNYKQSFWKHLIYHDSSPILSCTCGNSILDESLRSKLLRDSIRIIRNILI
ncbi:uncharacterized protein CMU_027650 [Cryptosporidium muris RN66]|uniref:Vacuolar membrane-associated protein Iml1 N-terminal domain-containing protein n=1 Tax=Cryptosporidium muris (strain RN66) TaxID=441375 RepID=B6ABK3_CRYMR|nr:uncharacterized protein CMU_027650 [Cryptosporidium muris RN66]EEA05755.1 hypothetical protein, conserved [Cryptosporidium muris RN66]|eukprot:XP_002140104.1 hypothetical protein [Cryptosporidium muris RN66]